MGSSPDVVGGVVYVGSGDGKIYAISAPLIANSGVPMIYIIIAIILVILVIAAIILFLRKRKNKAVQQP